MTRAQTWLLHLSNLGVGATGVVYFVMKHLLTSDDPFSVVNHPAQPAVQHLHVLVAPLLVFAAGLAWAAHAAPNLDRGAAPGRRTGLLLMTTFAPMAASGYLLQIAVEPEWQRAWLVVHVVTSLAWALGSALHLAFRRYGAGGR